MRRRLISLIALAAVAVPALALASAMNGTFTSKLTGPAERPAGDPNGKGKAKITITGRSVCWRFTVSGIDKPLAAHIHKGKAGTIGPIVVPFGAAYKAKGCTRATAALAAAISKKPKLYYVNIHTKRYPGGAVRGQLVKISSTGSTTTPPPTTTTPPPTTTYPYP